jgi:hypothetical protein
MRFAQFNSSQASIKSVNTGRYLNDVELAKDLLENAKQLFVLILSAIMQLHPDNVETYCSAHGRSLAAQTQNT